MSILLFIFGDLFEYFLLFISMLTRIENAWNGLHLSDVGNVLEVKQTFTLSNIEIEHFFYLCFFFLHSSRIDLNGLELNWLQSGWKSVKKNFYNKIHHYLRTLENGALSVRSDELCTRCCFNVIGCQIYSVHEMTKQKAEHWKMIDVANGQQ